VLLALSLILYLAAPAGAQEKKKEPPLKTVHGQVIDKQENPIPEAIVSLKNKRTGAVKTYIADDQGGYHFSGLDPNADYEIHAEFKGAASATRTVSSFDSRRDILIDLKILRK
jgi:hypothetical protein